MVSPKLNLSLLIDIYRKKIVLSFTVLQVLQCKLYIVSDIFHNSSQFYSVGVKVDTRQDKAMDNIIPG